MTDYSKGDINDHIANLPSKGQIIRHQKKIFDILEIDPDDMKDYTPGEKVWEIRHTIESCEDFDQLADLCELFKIPYLNTCSQGYGQGDYADIFICHTAKFEKQTGCTDTSEKSMQGSADLWGYWAWGDVYGFNIEAEGFGDSCFGFYGDNHEKSGLLDMARESIDHHLRDKWEKRMQRLKTLISNRVPLNDREKIMNLLN